MSEALTVETTVEGGIFRAVIRGEFSLEAAKRVTQQAIAAAADARMIRVLLDATQVTGNPTQIERFHFSTAVADTAARVAGLAGQPPARFAWVAHEPILDPGRFGESVAISKGMKVRAFAELDEALEWLASDGESARH